MHSASHAGRTVSCAVVVAVAGLIGGLPGGAGVSSAAAQDAADVRTVPEIQTIMPQRVRPRVVAPEWQPVEVRRVKADVVIAGETARTTMAITLFNPASAPARCELAVPVPADAAVSAFSLDGLEGDPPARLLPRDEARAAFEEIVRRMIDPGLLEFAGNGLIRSSVFPVPAEGEQTFRVTYEHPVRGEGDEIEYVLPRSGSAGAAPEWAVSVRVDDAAPIVSVFSPSHAAEFEIDEAGDATLAETTLKDGGAFRFVAMRRAADGPSLAVFAYPDPEAADAGYFMLVMAAGDREDDADPLPREVTIVLDRSGSMQGEKFEQATRAALQVVRALGPNESFRIIDYSSDVAGSGPAVAATPEAVRTAAARLGELRAVGGTNINEALLAAVRPEPTAGTLPIVLFLTDGLPTVGVTAEKAIRDNVLGANGGGRRLFTFGVGDDVNVPLLADLARESRAVADFVSPGEDVEAAVGRVFERLSGPVLADLVVGATARGCGFEPAHDLFPRTPGDLFEDQRLIVLGRYRGSPMAFTVSGIGAGGGGAGVVTHRVEFDDAGARTENAHIARLWAQQKVTWLIDELRSAGADPEVQKQNDLRDDPRLAEIIDEIVTLSTTHGILTEYTAFLATEEGLLAGGQSPEFGLNRVFQQANEVRAGQAGVRLGEAQAARRANIDAGRPMSIDDNFRITADAAEPAAVGGGGGGRSPVLDSAVIRAVQEYQARREASIQQIGPDTLYRRGGRWMDAGVVLQAQAATGDDPAGSSGETPEPAETVEFGGERYFALAAELAAAGRQGLLSVPGEVEIMHRGRRIVIRNPG